MDEFEFFEMRFDLGTLDSGERLLPFGLLVNVFDSGMNFVSHQNSLHHYLEWQLTKSVGATLLQLVSTLDSGERLLPFGLLVNVFDSGMNFVSHQNSLHHYLEWQLTKSVGATLLQLVSIQNSNFEVSI